MASLTSSSLWEDFIARFSSWVLGECPLNTRANYLERQIINGSRSMKTVSRLTSVRAALAEVDKQRQSLLRAREEKHEAYRKEYEKIKSEERIVSQTILLANIPDLLVWERILKKHVGDSEEKFSLSRMCQMWYYLLKTDTASYMFHKVFPHLEDFLGTEDILQCRLVSKEWRSVIDKTLQSHLPLPKFIYLLETMELDLVFLPRPKCNLAPVSSNHLQLICQQTQASRVSNPFISRYLALGTTWEHPMYWNENRHYWILGRQILQVYGKELWHLSLNFDLNLPHVLVYKEIAKYLGLTPNLKTLHLECKHTQRAIPNDWDQLRVLTERLPMPDLPYLRALTSNTVPHPILNKLLKTYTNIEVLCVSPFMDSYSTGSNFKEGTVLPNLKKFISAFDVRSRNASAQWPKLESMEVTHAFHPLFNLKNVFDEVNVFGATLKHLTLTFHLDYTVFENVDAKTQKLLWLRLPVLETLELNINNLRLSSADFIVPLRSLKVLRLSYTKPANFCEEGCVSKTKQRLPNANEIIQVTQYLDCLYESNIWDIFPYLEQVTIKAFIKDIPSFMIIPGLEMLLGIETRDYTRKGYNNYLKSINNDN